MIVRFGLCVVAGIMLSAAPAKAWWWSGPAGCKDEAVEAATGYDPSVRSGVAGSFKRVEFKPDHTVVVLSGYENVEACGILPDRAKLEQLGLDVSGWKPGRQVEIYGMGHRTDDRRIWVDLVADDNTGTKTNIRPSR